jgi:hypothetical protein
VCVLAGVTRRLARLIAALVIVRSLLAQALDIRVKNTISTFSATTGTKWRSSPKPHSSGHDDDGALVSRRLSPVKALPGNERWL